MSVVKGRGGLEFEPISKFGPKVGIDDEPFLCPGSLTGQFLEGIVLCDNIGVLTQSVTR